MSTDYTLPPVPAHPDWQVDQCNWLERERDVIASYGHAVADPLLARIAELEAKHAEDQGVISVWCGRTNRAEDELDRLRAEVEALTAANAALVASNAALRADAERLEWLIHNSNWGFELDESYNAFVQVTFYTPSESCGDLRFAIDDAIAARKGEGSEG